MNISDNPIAAAGHNVTGHANFTVDDDSKDGNSAMYWAIAVIPIFICFSGLAVFIIRHFYIRYLAERRDVWNHRGFCARICDHLLCARRRNTELPVTMSLHQTRTPIAALSLPNLAFEKMECYTPDNTSSSSSGSITIFEKQAKKKLK